MCLGVPARILAVADAARMTVIAEMLGEQREVNLSCLAGPDDPLSAWVGDWVLVHLGFALSRIGEADALAFIDMLRQLDEAEDGRGHMKAALIG